MIPLSKQQCGNCRYARPWYATLHGTRQAEDGQTFCHYNTDYAYGIVNGWCGKWELHPDYYEVYGYPSEAEQLEQQRMMAFGPTHIGEHSPQPPSEFTYD